MPLFAALLLLVVFSESAFAEIRLYHLRVTLRNGKRYETISSFDPINYCHANGGSVVYLKDYSLIFSPEMKVEALRTWIDYGADLAGRWKDVLRANRMLRHGNHKALPKVDPLTLEDMISPP